MVRNPQLVSKNFALHTTERKPKERSEFLNLPNQNTDVYFSIKVDVGGLPNKVPLTQKGSK